MDAESLSLILDNKRAWSDQVYAACVAALEKARALPGMPEYPGQKEGYELAQALGDAVKSVIWRHARRYHDITEDTSITLTEEIFSVTLGHISDADLGALYYSSTRERWCHEHGVDAYPELNG
jgi:hypothetical protein